MSNLTIEHFDSKVLFTVARPVITNEFNAELESLVSSMTQKMYSEKGVGLAAPQIGDSRRILVADVGYVNGREYGQETVAMINPEVIWKSEDKVEASEGCLSYPNLDVKVERVNSIRVKYFSAKGEEREEEFTGWISRIIQHEIDHLDGVTLYTHASQFKRSMYMKKIKKLRRSVAKMTKELSA